MIERELDNNKATFQEAIGIHDLLGSVNMKLRFHEMQKDFLLKVQFYQESKWEMQRQTQGLELNECIIKDCCVLIVVAHFGS